MVAAVSVPGLARKNWLSGAAPGKSLPLNPVYLAKPGTDTAPPLQSPLAPSKHLLPLPGLLHLSESHPDTNPGTVVLGLGIPTLIRDKAIPAVVVADVDGVSLAGFMIDSGPMSSATLLQVGPAGSTADHSQNPTAMFD